MASSSSGVIVVGALPFDQATASTSGPPPGNVLLGAVGAWLAGGRAAICSVIPPEFPTERIRDIARSPIDLSRVRLVSAAEATSGLTEPIPEQLASVGSSWAVHVLRLSRPRQQEIVRAVSPRVGLTSVDVADIRGINGNPVAATPLSDVALLGPREAERLWPKHSPRDALRLLAKQGRRVAVITLGPNGSIGIRDEVVTWMPAFPLRKTPSYPGRDAYGGAFSQALLAGFNLRRAMAWASAAASAVMETASPLELMNEFARRTVASRARLLERESDG